MSEFSSDEEQVTVFGVIYSLNKHLLPADYSPVMPVTRLAVKVVMLPVLSVLTV